MFSLAGRVAMVTGASRGLGLRIAQAYANAGAHVLINSRDPNRVQEAVDQIEREGFKATPLAFDIRDADQTARAVEKIAQVHGRLDILVNNVGNRLRIPLAETTHEAFLGILDVNLAAAFRLTKLCAELMMPHGYGRIIMISSIAANQAAVGNAAYIAAKGGLNALTRALACEFGTYGITCNAISPGSFLTETNATALTGAAREMIERRVPLKRCGNPEEITGPAVFLASEEASYVSGQILAVDGGFTASF